VVAPQHCVVTRCCSFLLLVIVVAAAVAVPGGAAPRCPDARRGIATHHRAD
jgi:hypothetical protein